jgi:hypothetical protein
VAEPEPPPQGETAWRSPLESDDGGLREWLWPEPAAAVREVRFIFSSCGALLLCLAIPLALGGEARGSLPVAAVLCAVTVMTWTASRALGAWRGRELSQTLALVLGLLLLARLVGRIQLATVDPVITLAALASTLLMLWVGVTLGRAGVRALFAAEHARRADEPHGP